jgi:hypothetical protein
LKNKIFIRLVGGLVNQLFIYAFGFALSRKKNKELVIDNESGFGRKGDEYKSIYALGGLSFDDRLLTETVFKYLVSRNLFWHIARMLNLVYREKDPSKFSKITSNKIFFEGYWQSYRYFDEYKEQLKQNLSLRNTELSNISLSKNQILKSTNSVAIGMRFYEETTTASENHIVKEDCYYLKAIEKVEETISDPTYFIFTTNVVRAKSILNKYSNKNILYIEPIMNKDGAKLDLYLMSLCNHFIISNGTFYWWAAYLGEEDNSIIVAPAEGFINEDTIPSNWLTL